jgi:hypothetical protein
LTTDKVVPVEVEAQTGAFIFEIQPGHNYKLK